MKNKCNNLKTMNKKQIFLKNISEIAELGTVFALSLV
jgi:hypothetical protein